MTPAELAALQAYNDQQRQERKDAALKGYGLGVAAGAAGLGAAGLAILSPAQRAKVGQGLLGRLDQAKKAVQEFRADRPAGVNQGTIPVTPENIEKVRRAGTRSVPVAQPEPQPAVSEKQRVFEDVVKRRPLDAPDPELRRPEETGYRSQALAEYERVNPPSEAVKEARRQEAYVPRSYLEEQGFVPGNTMAVSYTHLRAHET